MADRFSDQNPGLNSPATKGVALTPNDAADLANTARALFVGVGGDVVVTLADDSAAVTLKNVASGAILSVRAKRVWATGTTATNIVALT